jgi:hypothetical protein
MAQRQDMQSTRIRQLVTEGDPVTLRKGFFLTIEGVLMRTTKTDNQVVWVPIALRQAIMKTHHDHPLSGTWEFSRLRPGYRRTIHGRA